MSSMAKSQHTRVVKLSAGDIRNNRFPLRGVIDLFPKSAIGGSSEATQAKRMLVLDVAGLDEPVRTDIPSDASTGRPRSMFRRRGWVRQFYCANQLAAGDEVLVRSLGGFRFSVRALTARGNGNGQQLLGFRPLTSRRAARRAVRQFTFIDLFAGIGGFRIGMERAGLRCLFSSEWDAQCQRTYEAWFGERPHGDIREIAPQEIPDHDVLVGGFPCQPFSIAGVTKKNALGHAHGFLDKAQGTLFFDVARIIETKRPAAFILENVKNLRSHDKGRTWHVISSTLSALDYVLFDKVIDAAAWVPQHRERIFIVGFDRRRFGWNVRFRFPDPPAGQRPRFRDILEPKVSPKYTLTDHLWTYLQDYARKHAAKGNGFGFGMTDLDGVSRTMSARYYKDGAEILIPQARGQNPRRLTPTEARRLLGFPEDLPVVVSDTQAYRQFGNAVVPKVVHAVAVELIGSLNAMECVKPKRGRPYKTHDCPPQKGVG